MTEKRLIVRDGDYAWIDTVTDTVIEVEDAFDLVNNLAEENEQLKKQRDELVQSIIDGAKISADAITKVWTGDDYD